MEKIDERIEDSMFEIKNNFISPKDQMSMSTKFDTKNIDRSGKPMISNPDIQTAGLFPPLGTPDITPREDLDGNQFKI